MSSAIHDPTSEAWSFEEHKADYYELCKQLWPSAQHDKTRVTVFSISVNRSFAVEITDAAGKRHDYVLRYPIKLDNYKRCDRDHCVVVVREVSLLQWLDVNYPGMKVPKIIMYDGTKNNAIQMPYMIQNRIPGQPLNEAIPFLTDEQWMDLAASLGRYFSNARWVTMPRAGHVNASGEVEQLDNSDQYIAIQPFGMADIADMLEAMSEATSTGAFIPDIVDPAHLNTHDVLAYGFYRRLATLLHNADPKEEGIDTVKLDHCRGILAKMSERGMFRDEDNSTFSLCHTDLFPRNIIVDLTKKGDDIISGIVDWDSPIFAPGFIACMPPAWLWAPETYLNRVGDFIGVFGYEDVQPENQLFQQVKATFDEEAGYFYRKTAYDRQYAVARIFVDYLQARDWRGHPLFDHRDKFVEEWMHDDFLALH